MTVNELIEELIQYDPELEVRITMSSTDSCDCPECCCCNSIDCESSIRSVSEREKVSGKKKVVKVWIRGA